MADTEISKVFGNDDTENKEQKPVDQAGETDKEDEKGAKDNPDTSADSEIEGAETKGENKDGKEKTYTQAQVDAMMARARKKYMKGSDEQEQPAEEDSNVENPKGDSSEETQQQRDLSTGITVDKLARAELKAQMAIDGVNPAKLVYACRMIDVNDVLDETGNYNEELAKKAIEDMLNVMPELKTIQSEGQPNFYFGAPEQSKQTDSAQEEKDEISKIFGN